MSRGYVSQSFSFTIVCVYFKPVHLGASKRGEAPLFNIPPPHAKNTSPYYGEGDKGGEVDLNLGFLETISSHPPTLKPSLGSIFPISFLLAQNSSRIGFGYESISFLEETERTSVLLCLCF